MSRLSLRTAVVQMVAGMVLESLLKKATNIRFMVSEMLSTQFLNNYLCM